MKPIKASLLFHPMFFISLFLLLANDFYWKQEYHNWLTGKLSDFSGLIVLPVFCFVLLPKTSRKIILLACGAFFVWWKSALSQPVIAIINGNLHWPVQRVVDYSDLFAMAVLPFTLQMKPKALAFHHLTFAGLKWTLGTITFLSLCATSMPYRSLFQAHPNSQDIYFAESFTQKRTAADILRSLQAKQVSYRMDSIMYYPVLNQQDIYYRLPSTADSTNAWKQVSQASDSTLYLRWKGAPYYLIPTYKAGSHLFQNIRFTLSENKKGTKTTITIQTFQEAGLKPYAWMDRAQRKALKETFEKIFSEP